ncbi:MAG TPA: DUF2177 family protein [Anaerolineales bacterium]|mgnify:FL=1|nr:DUF2177 family protein [Anaerolineales bacterium]HND49788.1 DUF2177 family protein [Anaerolineales bacterium]
MKLKLYLITFLAFLGIDSLWLGLVAPSFYKSQIGYIMAENPNFLAAGLFYLLFIFGMVVFIVEPGVREQTLMQAVARGALFGLVTYATYDLTNLATLEGWPILVTVVDLIWGTVLSAAVTLVSVWAGKRFIKA